MFKYIYIFIFIFINEYIYIFSKYEYILSIYVYISLQQAVIQLDEFCITRPHPSIFRHGTARQLLVRFATEQVKVQVVFRPSEAEAPEADTMGFFWL